MSRTQKSTITLFICLSIGMADLGTLTPHYPEFPYFADSLEREPYRGQFHFSLQGGWMNDINGLWYYKGEYHMTFQHFPHGLSWNQMHWGHAVSIDMLHWVQKPIALEPGVNAPGDCFSCSVVVDSANTAGFKTGTEDEFVAGYTATKQGTCLAYSNDKDATWQAYAGNPGLTSELLMNPPVIPMWSGTNPPASGWPSNLKPAKKWFSKTQLTSRTGRRPAPSSLAMNARIFLISR